MQSMLVLDVHLIIKNYKILFKKFSLKYSLLIKIYETVPLEYEDLLNQLECSLLICELNKTVLRVQNYKLD